MELSRIAGAFCLDAGRLDSQSPPPPMTTNDYKRWIVGGGWGEHIYMYMC